MQKRQWLWVIIDLLGGIWLLALTVRFARHDDLAMALITGAAGIALLVLGGQEVAKLRRS